MQWERKITGRPGQAHVFMISEDGAKTTACRIFRNPNPDEWEVTEKGIKCASCRKRVDPANAPTAPTWRG